MIFPLFKIFVSNIFSFGNFIEGFKKGPKGIIKNIAIILLLIYSFAVLGGLYIVNMNNFYNVMSVNGDVYVLPLVSIFISVVMTFLFGFISAASNYYTGSGEEQFLSMPMRSIDIFGAKFGVTLLTDSLFGALIVAIASVLLAAREGFLANPLLYAGILVTSVAVSIISVFIIYLLLIIVLLIFPAMRKKQLLSGIASAFLIIFAAGYGFFGSQAGVQISSTDGFTPSMINTAAQRIGLLGAKLPALKFLSMAAVGKPLPILAMLAIIATVVFGLIPLLAPLYIKTLNGFGDIKTKKISSEKVEQVIGSQIKSQSIFKALYFRDVKIVFREPSFFSNGPLIIIIMPAIFIVSFAVSLISIDKAALSELIPEIQEFLQNNTDKKEFIKYIITMAGAGIAVFLGNATNIASTSFSREGKALYDLKAMPIRNEMIAKVKFFHALTYVFVADLMVTILLLLANIFLGTPFLLGEFAKLIVGIIALSVAISLVLIFIDMFIDTANPKLQWENPIAAFKQNVNSIFGILAMFGAAAIIVGLAVIMPKNSLGIIITCVIFIVIDAPVGSAYFKYAVKKIDRMG